MCFGILKQVEPSDAEMEEEDDGKAVQLFCSSGRLQLSATGMETIDT